MRENQTVQVKPVKVAKTVAVYAAAGAVASIIIAVGRRL